MQFLRGELGNATLASDIYRPVEQSSGLTQGLVVMGVCAIVTATIGMCGAVRGSPKFLYCYAVSTMLMLVVQSILIALLNFSVVSESLCSSVLVQSRSGAMCASPDTT